MTGHSQWDKPPSGFEEIPGNLAIEDQRTYNFDILTKYNLIKVQKFMIYQRLITSFC